MFRGLIVGIQKFRAGTNIRSSDTSSFDTWSSGNRNSNDYNSDLITARLIGIPIIRSRIIPRGSTACRAHIIAAEEACNVFY